METGRMSRKRNHSEVGSSPDTRLHQATAVANGVLSYVLEHELGGRSNARGEPNSPRPQPHQIRGRVAAERSLLQPCAREAVHYAVRGTSSSLLQLLHRPVMNRQALPADVMRFRAALCVCDFQRDLHGGVTGPNAPATRVHLMELLRAGLRGERWERPAPVPASLTTVPASGPEAGEEEALDLFGEGVATTTGTAVEFSPAAYFHSDSESD